MELFLFQQVLHIRIINSRLTTRGLCLRTPGIFHIAVDPAGGRPGRLSPPKPAVFECTAALRETVDDVFSMSKDALVGFLRTLKVNARGISPGSEHSLISVASI